MSGKKSKRCVIKDFHQVESDSTEKKWAASEL